MADLLTHLGLGGVALTALIIVPWLINFWKLRMLKRQKWVSLALLASALGIKERELARHVRAQSKITQKKVSGTVFISPKDALVLAEQVLRLRGKRVGVRETAIITAGATIMTTTLTAAAPMIVKWLLSRRK